MVCTTFNPIVTLRGAQLFKLIEVFYRRDLWLGNVSKEAKPIHVRWLGIVEFGLDVLSGVDHCFKSLA